MNQALLGLLNIAIMNAMAANMIRILNKPLSAYQKMPIPQITSKINARINRKLLMMFYNR